MDEFNRTNAEVFVSILVRNNNNIPVMTKLKRGLKEQYMVVSAFAQLKLPFSPVNELAVLIAGSYAQYKNHTDTDVSLAKALKAYYGPDTGGKRFDRLVSKEYYDIRKELPHILALLRNTRLNYAKLFEDLQFWNDKTKLRWGTDFYL